MTARFTEGPIARVVTPGWELLVILNVIVFFLWVTYFWNIFCYNYWNTNITTSIKCLKCYPHLNQFIKTFSILLLCMEAYEEKRFPLKFKVTRVIDIQIILWVRVPLYWNPGASTMTKSTAQRCAHTVGHILFLQSGAVMTCFVGWTRS